MKRLLCFFLLALIPLWVSAFGLGEIKINSALDQPFVADIALLQAQADQLGSLHVSLASGSAFSRARIERSPELDKLKFELRGLTDNEPYIHVYSQEPIQVNFLNFLVEANWDSGKLFREYMVLLETPTANVNANAETNNEPDTKEQGQARLQISDRVIDKEYPDRQAAIIRSEESTPPTNTNHNSTTYVSITPTDTLWSIASEVRPNHSISVNRMMLALVRANPNAFLEKNVNGLIRGQMLRVPSESEIGTLTDTEALAEIRVQNNAWHSIKKNLPVNSDGQNNILTTRAGDDLVQKNSNAELKLIGTTGEINGEVQASEGNNIREKQLLRQEDVEVLKQEKIELEKRIFDLERTLELRTDELARIQERNTVTVTPEEPVTTIKKEAVAQKAPQLPHKSAITGIAYLKSVKDVVVEKIKQGMATILSVFKKYVEASMAIIQPIFNDVPQKARVFFVEQPVISLSLSIALILVVFILLIVSIKARRKKKQEMARRFQESREYAAKARSNRSNNVDQKSESMASKSNFKKSSTEDEKVKLDTETESESSSTKASEKASEYVSGAEQSDGMSDSKQDGEESSEEEENSSLKNDIGTSDGEEEEEKVLSRMDQSTDTKEINIDAESLTANDAPVMGDKVSERVPTSHEIDFNLSEDDEGEIASDMQQTTDGVAVNVKGDSTVDDNSPITVEKGFGHETSDNNKEYFDGDKYADKEEQVELNTVTAELSIEQTDENMMATKLDLAKAYVELSDNESAKLILDDVMAKGNDKQRKQAKELLKQI